MKPQTQALLHKSERALRVAGRLLADGDMDFAAGRAYYAMFYAAEALLFEQGLTFSKHAGVHAAFGEHFAKTGLLDAKYHRYLLDAFSKRLQGDSGFEAAPTAEETRELVAQAAEFLAVARTHLEQNR
jgi:uncharacterized protein (UPF0332 family)